MQALMAAWQADVARQPQWVQIWLNVMMIVLLGMAAVFSFVRVEARWVLVGFLLGLGHVIFWTPVLVYLLHRRPQWHVKETLSGKWIVLAVTVLTISLAFDYGDVFRWVLGDR